MDNKINLRGALRGKGSMNTIVPYHGEFLVNPVPLECSFNYCSHKCAYCFANLSSPLRKASTTVTNNLLQHYPSRTTLPAMLLQGGYPVCLSNKVDPFASSNYQISVPVIQTMVEKGIPVQVQTRGGRGIDEVLTFLPPSVWYVSITMNDDDIRRRVEPGAPTIASRLALVEQLTSLGHRVVIGMNPLVREWMPAPVEMLLDIKQRGAEGVWIEGIHLNTDQIANLSDRERDAIGWDILVRARRRKCLPDDSDFFDDTRSAVTDMGMQVYSMGQPNRSDFFQPWRETYGPLYPIMQDLVNWCHDQGKQPGQPVTFWDMWTLFKGKLPKGLLPIGQYVGSVARNAWKDHGLTNQLSYEYMLGIVWEDPRIKGCPARMPSFSYMSRREGRDSYHEYDEEGMPLLTFNPEGTLKYWYDVEREEYY